MPDGNAAIKDMNFADGEWKHGTVVKTQVKIVADGVPGTAMMAFKDRQEAGGQARRQRQAGTQSRRQLTSPQTEGPRTRRRPFSFILALTHSRETLGRWHT